MGKLSTNPTKTKRARYVTPRVVLNVTKEVIEESKVLGVRHSAHCMVEEAVKAAVPGSSYRAVDLASIRWSDPAVGLRYTFLTPRVAQKAILDFDAGRDVKPFRCELRNAHVTRAGWKANHPSSDRDQDKTRAKRMDSLKKARVHGTTRRGGSPIPRMGVRREFGLRTFEA